jgi:COP9 signalosome complex subunit 6
MSMMEKKDSVRGVHLHPLAITSICDHHTRVKVGGSLLGKDDPVLGLLFGVQQGLEVQIIDGTDAIYEVKNGVVALDMLANFPDPHAIPDEDGETNKNSKLDLIVAPFESINYELIGWYAVSNQSKTVPDWCQEVHAKVQSVNAAPLFLLLNSSPDPNSKQLPLSVFESEEQINQDTGAVTTYFTTLDFKLETTQMEKVCVEQITKQGSTGGVSSVEIQNASFVKSLEILKTKVRVIIAALQEMKDQPPESVDHDLLRTANRICQQIPAVDSDKFEEFFNNELVDSTMTTYLGTATKTFSILSDVNDLYSRTYMEKFKVDSW